MGIWEWGLDTDELVLASEDFAGLVVDLLAGPVEAEIESVSRIVIRELLAVVVDGQELNVNALPNFQREGEEGRARHGWST